DLLSAFAGTVLFATAFPDYYHPGRSASVKLDGQAVMHFGQIHPDVAATRKFKQGVFLAEVMLEQLYRASLRMPRYQKLSRYPAVVRDFSFLFDETVSFAQIEQAIRSLSIPELQSVAPQEIFRGGNIGAGKYSLLVRTTFQSHEATLRDDQTN